MLYAGDDACVLVSDNGLGDRDAGEVWIRAEGFEVTAAARVTT